MTIVRGVMGALFKAVQADKVFEERTAVEHVDLYFKPVYAFEYHWKPKDKKAVAESDQCERQLKAAKNQAPDLAQKYTDTRAAFFEG
jgi:hypothetical protein